MHNLFSCDRCGTLNRIGDRVCKKCGIQFQYYCPQCRNQVGGGDTVCSRCGNTLEWQFGDQGQSKKDVRGYGRNELEKKKVSWAVAVLVILVILLLGVTGYYIYSVINQKQNQVTVAENITNKIQTEKLAPDTTPPAISNVLVNKISDTGVIIYWITDEPSTSQVIWNARNGAVNASQPKEALVKEHYIELVDLKADTTYYFKVRSVDQAGNESTSVQKTFNTGNKTGVASVSVVKSSMSIEEKPPISGMRTYVKGEIRNTGEIPVNINDIVVMVKYSVPGTAGDSEIQAILDPYPYEINPGGTHKFYAILPNNANPSYTVSARLVE